MKSHNENVTKNSIKPSRHRRTQSNLEMDFKPQQQSQKILLNECQLQQLMEEEKVIFFVDSIFSQLPKAQQTFMALESKLEFHKKVIVDRLEDEVDLTNQKKVYGLNFGKKLNKNCPSIHEMWFDKRQGELFSINEQNDILSSIDYNNKQGQRDNHRQELMHNALQTKPSDVSKVGQQLQMKIRQNIRTDEKLQQDNLIKQKLINLVSQRRVSNIEQHKENIPLIKEYNKAGSNSNVQLQQQIINIVIKNHSYIIQKQKIMNEKLKPTNINPSNRSKKQSMSFTGYLEIFKHR